MALRLPHAGNSLTLKLSLLFAISSIVLIAAIGLYLDVALDRILEQEHAAPLAGDVERFRNVLAQAKDLAQIATGDGKPDALGGMRNRLHVAMLGKNDEVLVSNIPSLPPSYALLPPTPADRLPTRSVVWKSPAGEFYRVVNAWAHIGPARAEHALLIVALNVSTEQELLATFKDALLIALAVAVLVSIGLGYLVARRGLQPLEQITATVRDTSSSKLGAKLELDDAPAELRDLAAAFNSMLDRLNDSFSRLSQYSSDLAHEFRTPINNLMGEAQVCLTRSRSADEYREVIESSMEEYERLSRMVENMLFLARCDFGEVSVTRHHVAVRPTLEKLADYFQVAVDDRNLKIRCVGDADVYADPDMLRRAVSNLLANAVRYAEAGSDIVLETTRQPEGSTVIRVTNAGPAIASEHLDRLFDRFYRVDASREQSGGGAGLGLAIVKSIMQMHGGAVTVGSAQPSGPTSFTLRFPPHRPDSGQARAGNS